MTGFIRRALLVATVSTTGVGTAAHSRCLDDYSPEVADLDIEITAAADDGVASMAAQGIDADGLPPHCLIEGVINRRTGVDGVEYGIGFALALPREWNGRFLFQGGGGLNGTVRPPLGTGATGGRSALERGFAVASTDSGHEGAGFDSSFFADQQAALNFLYQAIDKVNAAAEALIQEHYGRRAEHDYYVGCSTGGREAMIASQRFPREFDGIVAGAPAMRTGYSNLAMRSVSIALNHVAERDADGDPIPGTALTSAEQQLVVDGVLEQCDARDGLADDMIFDTAGCDFDPGTLVCGNDAAADECLTEAQADAIRAAMAGPKTDDGHAVYSGYFYDTGINASGRGAIPGLLNGAPSPVGGPVTALEQDVAAEARAVAMDPSTAGDTYRWTNLSTFSGHGGRLLFYHGVSDPWFSAMDTVEYYERLAAANGGAASVREFSRLFLVPGMGHCGGGELALDRFDMLSAIVDWVENDTAPERVTATGDAFPARSRPLCPYPEHAHYSGEGDPDDAASFSCRNPE